MPNSTLSTTPTLALLRRAVIAASLVTRAVQARLAAADRLSKADDSPVTIADLAAQAVVVHALTTILGTRYPIVGEESSAMLRAGPPSLRAATLAAAAIGWNLASDVLSGPPPTEADLLAAIDLGAAAPPTDAPFFTLDPIDGTKGFIRGHQYAICLAFIERGQPTLAALACPNLSADFSRPFTSPDAVGTLFLAESLAAAAPTHPHAGSAAPIASAFIAACDPGAPLHPLAPSARDQAAPLRFCQSFDPSHSDHSTTARLIERLRTRGVTADRPAQLDSQAKYGVLARNQADVLVRRPQTLRRDYIWDVAPGALIAQAAGFKVTDSAGAPLDFAHGTTLKLNDGILAARPADHTRILAELSVLPRPPMRPVGR